MYCGLNLKVLVGKNTQKVSKQKICRENSGFVIRNSLFDELNEIKVESNIFCLQNKKILLCFFAVFNKKYLCIFGNILLKGRLASEIPLFLVGKKVNQRI